MGDARSPQASGGGAPGGVRLGVDPGLRLVTGASLEREARCLAEALEVMDHTDIQPGGLPRDSCRSLGHVRRSGGYHTFSPPFACHPRLASLVAFDGTCARRDRPRGC